MTMFNIDTSSKVYRQVFFYSFSLYLSLDRTRIWCVHLNIGVGAIGKLFSGYLLLVGGNLPFRIWLLAMGQFRMANGRSVDYTHTILVSIYLYYIYVYVEIITS